MYQESYWSKFWFHINLNAIYKLFKTGAIKYSPCMYHFTISIQATFALNPLYFMIKSICKVSANHFSKQKVILTDRPNCNSKAKHEIEGGKRKVVSLFLK